MTGRTRAAARVAGRAHAASDVSRRLRRACVLDGVPVRAGYLPFYVRPSHDARVPTVPRCPVGLF